MLKKWVGCNLALLVTVLCFILFKLLVHHEYHGQILAGGVFFVIVYSVPFIILGGLTSFILEKSRLNVSRDVFYFFVGVILAGIVIWTFRFTTIDIVLFIVITCIVGSFAFRCSYWIQNNIINYCIGLAVPIGVVIFMAAI